jgi:NAD(P)-dependent dehydrogenase (short-subunit alcohol dehydrogenase family)
MGEQQTIVITGSTRGIGRGLATEYLKMGHNVVVTGRSRQAVDAAVAELAALGPVLGRPCDVRSLEANQAVWDAAVARFGRVDVWINNAAIATDHVPFAELPPDQVAATVETNLLGTMYGARVAIAGMLRQGGGKVYTFEGFGSDDMTGPGLTTYGTTKRAIRYLTASLAKEYEDSPVIIGAMSPGIVATDLLIYSSKSRDPAQWERSKRILNILGDRVETVTPWLARAALANTKQGGTVAWLTRGKAIRRFMAAPFVKRDIISEFEASHEVVVR